MSMRSHVKTLFAVSLVLVVLGLPAAPAQAAAWSPGDPGLSLWSALADSMQRFFFTRSAPSAQPQRTKLTTMPPGGGSTNSCTPGAIGCNSNPDGNGTHADPYGTP